jgi:hypothetical protein
MTVVLGSLDDSPPIQDYIMTIVLGSHDYFPSSLDYGLGIHYYNPPRHDYSPR